jgi:pseudomonalisin
MTRFVLTLAIVVALPAQAATPQRLPIDDLDRVTLAGNVPLEAQPEVEIGRSAPDLPLERMILLLELRPGARQQLDQLLSEQQDPDSPLFHRWLTPEEFGARFGLRDEEIGTVVGWLERHGFAIDEIAKGRGWINFSGTVAQVERAFATEMHEYAVAGTIHHANAIDPSLPRALSPLVTGIVTLHDFHSESSIAGVRSLAEADPQFTTGAGNHYLSPTDFATIYNTTSTVAGGNDGSGQTIAVIARTDIKLADVQHFRSNSGLPANDPVFVHNGPDPGNRGGGEEFEGDLDVQWTGAVAPGATIDMVISASTKTTDGVALSAQFVVNHNLAPVTTASFSLCEARMGGAQQKFYNAVWAQAAAQGISAFVSSGDSGAAGCNSGGDKKGFGKAVNGLCSTPFDICVGGTQFSDTQNPSAYWSPTNDPATGGSALSYIPEAAWNTSGTVPGGANLWATGGGMSTVYGKPSWQVAPGVPTDRKRDVPDVSLSASTHDAYLLVNGGLTYGAGGTSASSPAFAGLMALIVQKTGARQGNANPTLYKLANSQYQGGGPAVFHDITNGGNSVPNVKGFACQPGYDQATGLGSVDGGALVSNWP